MAFDTLQRQIQHHWREIIKLSSSQNPYLPISDLPAELLSEVFLYIVESGLQIEPAGLGTGGTYFGPGTFRFRQVCRRWDKVAVSSPRLWTRWPSSAGWAWSRFNPRSKNAPIFLTWRPHPLCSTMADPTVPRRIRQLDFHGSHRDLENLLGGSLDSSLPSNASSIRLHIVPYDEHGPQEHTTNFLFLSFPELSKLDIKNFLPDSSSSVFTTSNLVSLKLAIPYDNKNRLTRSQFSQIFQHHSNLQELHLWKGGMPRLEPPGTSPPSDLPQLVDLQLHGADAVIAQFMGFIGMSAHLDNVFLDFESISTPSPSALAIQEIVTTYYERWGPTNRPHKADRITISSGTEGRDPIFDAGSHPTSNLKLKFGQMDEALVEEICLLFPLNHVCDFIVRGLNLPRGAYSRILRKMKSLLHLQLDDLDIEPVLGALRYDDQYSGTHMTRGDAQNHLHTRR